jgi:opacity protein-like surface antigen
MKKITSVLVGLSLATSAFANSHDLSQKFYVGADAGASFSKLNKEGKRIEQDFNASQKSALFNGNLHVGKRFGVLGVELSAGILSAPSISLNNQAALLSVKFKETNLLAALDLGYYFPVNQQFNIRGTAGLAAIHSKYKITGTAQGVNGALALAGLAAVLTNEGFSTTTTATNMDGTRSTTRLAPKVGLGTQFVVNQNVSLTANVNLLFPISHKTLKYVVTGTIGANYHF